MNAARLGVEEGETCGRDGCKGVIEYQKPDNCSCHISPPCHSCVSVALHCPECDWEAEEEPFNDHVLTVHPVSRVIEAWRPRELDASRIDWRSFSHSNSSMIKEGVYPETATRAEVEQAVKGTFGGRFEHFGNGKFKYIAYTD
jgi:hypothetical protein